jgi:protein arginine kinase
MAGGGLDGDIVLSSSIRLARNLKGVPFPNRATEEQLAGVVDELRKSINLLGPNGKYMLIDMEKLSPLERHVLVEKHIISPNYAQQPENRALIISDDAGISIMVNEEDHLRIQSMTPGLSLDEAFTMADNADDALEAKHDFAFNEQMGYLTSCPTNLGTGLRASVMMHLPALVLTGQINVIVNAATQLGLAVRGLYGEGSEAVGNVFQISNQQTLGYTEQEIIANVSSVVRQFVDQERAARKVLLSQSQDVLADRVWRAYGILSYARSISGKEALSMLSEVRLGIDLGMIDKVPAMVFNELLVTTRPNFLQKMTGKNALDPANRDKLRAQVIREKLKGGKKNV